MTRHTEQPTDSKRLCPDCHEIDFETTHCCDFGECEHTGKLIPKCKNCYNKGFSTQLVQVNSAPDFVGDKGSSKVVEQKHYCSCKKGRKLQKIQDIDELMEKEQPEWEKEFSKKFNVCKNCGAEAPNTSLGCRCLLNNRVLNTDELKFFIRSLLATARREEREKILEEIKEEIKNLGLHSRNLPNYAMGYSEAKVDIIKKIEGKL